jgi:threonine/homoserine/homoserine lactone efflux protein
MKLEDQYRLLGRVFPRHWREQHGEELVTTLVDGSKPGQRLASPGDVFDVVRRGVQLRVAHGGPLFLILTASSVMVATTVVIHSAVTPTSSAFLATSLVVVLAPGTGVVYSVSTAVSRGWRQGSLAALGCTLGILPHLAAAAMGLSGLMQASAHVFEVVRWVGVVYLGYLGLGMLRSSGRLAEEEGTEEMAGWATVRRGVLINVLNPKLTIFFFAFLPQFIDSPPTLLDARLLGLSSVFMAMTLAVFLIYAAFAAKIRERVLSTPKLLRRIEQSLGAVLLGFAARLAVAER